MFSVASNVVGHAAVDVVEEEVVVADMDMDTVNEILIGTFRSFSSFD